VFHNLVGEGGGGDYPISKVESIVPRFSSLEKTDSLDICCGIPRGGMVHKLRMSNAFRTGYLHKWKDFSLAPVKLLILTRCVRLQPAPKGPCQ
jgi:hypothetical protein